MTKDEALKLALEKLEFMNHVDSIFADEFDFQINAIKEALAQPEQHQDWCASLTKMLMSMPPKPAPCNCKPPQRTWVGLTRDEILEARWHNKSSYKFARVLEAKLREKNT